MREICKIARRGYCLPPVVVVGAALVLVGCSSQHGQQTAPSNASDGAATQAVVTIRTVTVGDAGNAPAAIVPFRPGILKSCNETPARRVRGCQLVGGVNYPFQIGQLEVTVGEYVAFLNTVDPNGTDAHDLYTEVMSPSKWPKYGSVRRASGRGVAPGQHYSVAYPQWANKPFGFADFPRAARFVNSLTNGQVLSRTTSSAGGFEVTTYTARLSRETETGMYDLRGELRGATRTRSGGFVVPSQNEWIKAAYFDPRHGGTFSYWEYPTGPFKAPNASSLNTSGEVVNGAHQPLATYTPRGHEASPGTFPTWCPSQAGESACSTVNPHGMASKEYQSTYMANMSSVGQTQTTSPWGTLDQGGNAVEWTDTIAPSPLGSNDPRAWRYLHGGVANAPAYQMWISAVGRVPERDPFAGHLNPWVGFRIGVIGNVGGGSR